MVWQGPRLGFVAETGRFVAMETPWVRFSCLLLCLASYFSFFAFLFFLFLFFPASRYVYLLRVSSSVQPQFATVSKYLFYSTCSFCCVICTLPHLGILLFFIRSIFFFVALISRVSFFSCCCALVPGTPALDLLTLNLQRLVFLCPTICDHRIFISLWWRIRKDTGGTADVVR